MVRTDDSTTLSAQQIIWNCDSSDDSSEWDELPHDQQMTFVDYHVMRVVPSSEAAGPSCYTNDSIEPMTVLQLPVAVAFRTGITIQQWVDMQQGTLNEPRKTPRQSKRIRSIFFITLGVLIAVFIAVLVPLLMIHLTKSEITDTVAFSLSTPTEKALYDAIVQCANVEALVNSTDSPQRKSWTFLLSEITSATSKTMVAQPWEILQRFAMATLFYSFSREPQAHLHECKWSFNNIQQGILNCTHEQNISSINMSLLGLKGDLPMELGCLSHLQYFNISDNSIRGTLPNLLSRLTLLRSIDVSKNKLSGTLPQFDTPFYNLETIILDNNTFYGSLPSSWDAPMLPRLTYLSVKNNSLSGSILPNTWGKFSQLTTLDLSVNNFSGVTPDGLKYAKKIHSLNLSYNSLTGSQDVICSLTLAGSLITDCLTAKMSVTYSTLNAVFPCDCCTNCCSKSEGCFPQVVH